MPESNNARLISIGGMSGSGKTTLASALAQALPNAVHLDSDRMRKALFDIPETEHLPPEAYTSQATQNLISEMQHRTKQVLESGKTVIVSATFLSDQNKAQQEQLARDAGVPFVGVWLQADLGELFKRVAARINNPSDADKRVIDIQAKRKPEAGNWSVINASMTPEQVLAEALKVLESSARPKIRAPLNPPVS